MPRCFCIAGVVFKHACVWAECTAERLDVAVLGKVPLHKAPHPGNMMSQKASRAQCDYDLSSYICGFLGRKPTDEEVSAVQRQVEMNTSTRIWSSASSSSPSSVSVVPVLLYKSTASYCAHALERRLHSAYHLFEAGFVDAALVFFDKWQKLRAKLQKVCVGVWGCRVVCTDSLLVCACVWVGVSGS